MYNLDLHRIKPFDCNDPMVFPLAPQGKQYNINIEWKSNIVNILLVPSNTSVSWRVMQVTAVTANTILQKLIVYVISTQHTHITIHSDQCIHSSREMNAFVQTVHISEAMI